MRTFLGKYSLVGWEDVGCFDKTAVVAWRPNWLGRILCRNIRTEKYFGGMVIWCKLPVTERAGVCLETWLAAEWYRELLRLDHKPHQEDTNRD